MVTIEIDKSNDVTNIQEFTKKETFALHHKEVT